MLPAVGKADGHAAAQADLLVKFGDLPYLRAFKIILPAVGELSQEPGINREKAKTIVPIIHALRTDPIRWEPAEEAAHSKRDAGADQRKKVRAAEQKGAAHRPRTNGGPVVIAVLPPEASTQKRADDPPTKLPIDPLFDLFMQPAAQQMIDRAQRKPCLRAEEIDVPWVAPGFPRNVRGQRPGIFIADGPYGILQLEEVFLLFRIYERHEGICIEPLSPRKIEGLIVLPAPGFPVDDIFAEAHRADRPLLGNSAVILQKRAEERRVRFLRTHRLPDLLLERLFIKHPSAPLTRN